MKRREFIAFIGATAAVWPLAARAQQSPLPVIGIIGAGERGGFADLLVATRTGVKEFGFVEGQNFEFAYAFAAGRFDELPKLAADLVRRLAALIISTGVGSGLAAKGASSHSARLPQPGRGQNRIRGKPEQARRQLDRR